MPYSPVEREAFQRRDDDPSIQCKYAVNGIGPRKNCCPACDNALRPERGYQVYDDKGKVIVGYLV